MFYMFEVQIPVDAYPVFTLKRRSFLFVIDNGNRGRTRGSFSFALKVFPLVRLLKYKTQNRITDL